MTYLQHANLARVGDPDDNSDERYADLYEATEETILDERDRAIRAALVKPGSRVSALLNDGDGTDEWFADLNALIRMAADVLADPKAIGLSFKTLVNRTIAEATKHELHAAVLKRIAEDKRAAEEDRALDMEDFDARR